MISHEAGKNRQSVDEEVPMPLTRSPVLSQPLPSGSSTSCPEEVLSVSPEVPIP